MNKRTTILLHLAVWGFLFLSPLTFMRGEHVTFLQYLATCVSPLLLLIVFYVNYLWLTPKYYVTGKRSYYWLVNIVVVVSFGIFLHFWMTYIHDLFADNRPRHHDPTILDMLFFIIRDIFSFVVSAAIATMIVLSMRWQHSEEARLEAEAARADAELKNLRSQINPHFLLNTLNNIYALTAIDAERAQQAIQQLSKLLRHMLYDNQQSEVDIKDEILFLENYINLMKIRLPQNVEVRFTKNIVNPNQKVAPLIFISLVENAFKHGVSPVDPSFIHIHISADAHLVCEIENSNHPKTEKDRSGHGIGLQQVRQRLDLAYPHRYEWEKGVSEDGKTYRSCITIHLKT